MSHILTLAMRGYVFPRSDALRQTPIPRQTFDEVRVRALRPFYGLRRLIEAGEVVTLAEPDAESAIALGRAVRA
jgi:hypothetical protein